MENCRNSPGFRTRWASASARSVSGMSIKLMKAIAKSNVVSANGSPPALATRQSIPSGSCSSACLSCAMKTSEMSMAGAWRCERIFRTVAFAQPTKLSELWRREPSSHTPSDPVDAQAVAAGPRERRKLAIAVPASIAALSISPSMAMSSSRRTSCVCAWD